MFVDPASPEAVAAFVRACRLGVVATVDDSGRPEAALVGLAALDDGTLIFDAPRASRKIANIGHDPHVAVVVGWSDDTTVQIEGVAAVAHGELRGDYGRAYNEQFPGSRALDDDFAVVAIRPTWLRSYTATAGAPDVTEAHWAPSTGGRLGA
ncbi:pyridoxamine 5'-phosphate oxidase family protein [Nocardioides alcanivorans]|uniref:pyridoxamine 5'-phosphate oxidase family protein n=1 Tax=Nocardioides alcanivorans TaxID=2897352 RepID=UPI001F193702|nr:pyridoxamine 5'-phosphate oxidase family protein [Nocardioides alcanivorans]